MLINDLRSVTFRYKDTDKMSMGFIAQEISQVIPDIVTELNGTMSVSYDGLIPVMLDALKDQEKKIQELENLIRGRDERI